MGTLRVPVKGETKPVGLTGEDAVRASNLFIKLARWGIQFCFESKKQLLDFVQKRQIPARLTQLLADAGCITEKIKEKIKDIWQYLTSFEPAPLRRGLKDVIPAAA